MSLFDLKGRVALVTGASRGIGFAAGTALAQAGADLIVCSTNAHALEPVVELARKLGRKAVAFQTDVSNRKQVIAMIKESLEVFGKVDILVNNAGITVRKPTIEMTDEEWRRVIDVNLGGTFVCCQEVGKHMIFRNQGGKIINVASLLSTLGVPQTSIIAYACSKGGVASLTKSLAVEWAKHRINVNAVAPGYIRTDLTQALQHDEDRSGYIVSRIPLGRWGEPEDLKGAFVFLASRASDYITGQIIWVDGGWTAG